MTTQRGTQLAQAIRATVAEFKEVCAGVDEELALRAPAGRWSPKEIVSHVAGPDERGVVVIFQLVAGQDDPLIPLVPEQTWMTEPRSAMRFAAIAELACARYEEAARFAEGLPEDAFSRRARIPALKDSPWGDHPNLETLIGGFGQYHLKMHVDHLREVLSQLKGQ